MLIDADSALGNASLLFIDTLYSVFAFAYPGLSKAWGMPPFISHDSVQLPLFKSVNASQWLEPPLCQPIAL